MRRIFGQLLTEPTFADRMARKAASTSPAPRAAARKKALPTLDVPGDGAADVPAAPMAALTAHEAAVGVYGEDQQKHGTPAQGPEGDLQIAPLGPQDFAPETLLRVYRTMLTGRRLDDKMLNLLKQGKGFFHIGTSGHEGVQTALGLYAKGGHDYFCLYYRDLTLTLMLGMTVKETPPRPQRQGRRS